uniref:hypothetical protein n=1 Tax=Bartonella raoultii TaxID=1457020 RepID=UPI001ABA5E42
MKKLHATQRANNLKVARFSFVRVFSLAVAAIFLSNISPVYAKSFDIIAQVLQSIEKATAVYSQGKGNQNSFNDSASSKAGYLTALNTALAAKTNASSDYANFLNDMLSRKRNDNSFVNLLAKDGNAIQKAKQKTSNALAQKNLELSIDDDENGKASHPIQVSARSFASARAGASSTNLGQGSNAAGQESVAIGFKTQSTGKFAITMGAQAQATGEDSLAVGRMAHALGKSSVALGSEYNDKSQHGDNDYTTAKADYSTALGAVSRALEFGSTAVGHRAYATEKSAVSIGFYSRANKDHAIALGANSIANVASGVAGYAPSLKGAATNTSSTWKSTYGAVSVGDIANNRTRQIGGVAAGTVATDAVNVAQLQSLQTYVDKGWKLSVDGKNAKVVGIDDTVDFATGSNNFIITKSESNNKVKFDLAKNLTLESLKVGGNTFDKTGLIIANGPQITTTGMNAGSKKITNVANGTDDTDAVNFAQLKNAVSTSKDSLSEWSNNKVRLGVFDNSTTRGSVVIGPHWEEKHGDGAAVYKGPKTKSDFAIAIGTTASVENNSENGVAIGYFATVESNVKGGIALGTSSHAKVGGNIAGYDPKTGKASILTSIEWKSREGALSIGNPGSFTRQIVGVAAGTQDTDAVNVAQLKALRGMITQKGGWNLAVEGAEKTAISSGDTLALAAGSENLSITSNDKEKKITFDLAKDLTLDSVKAGENAFDKTGLIIANGPKIMTDGIDAGNKKITNVAEGTDTTDAVNFGQLNKAKQEVQEQIEKQVASNSFVKQDTDTKHITIGKETDGDKIDITNRDGNARTLSGVKAGTEETDAVNFGQLQKIQTEVTEQVAANSFVKQDSNTKHITIGKETGGDKIDISNNEDEKRTLTGIKAGDLSEGSHEAVIGSQLFTTNQNVTHLQTAASNIAKSFGGNAKYENGQWTDPTFTVKTIKKDGQEETTTYHNVAAAFAGVGTSITNVQNKVTEQINNVVSQVAANSFVQQDDTTKRITIGAKEEGNEINIANSSKADRILSGVKAATKENEAVNKGQLEESLKQLSDNLQSEESAVVHYDKDDKNGTINYTSVTLGGKEKKTVALHNLADGNIAKDSHDAITGGQINKIGEDIAKSLGGKATFQNGVLTQPTYKLSYISKDGSVTESPFQGVGTAFAGLDANIKNVNDRIKEVTQSVAQDSLSWSKTENAFNAQHEKDGAKTNSKITHLLDGNIATDSTDAITGKQLYSMSNTLATYFGGGAGYDEKGKLKAPTFTLKTVNGEGKEEDKTYKNVAEALTGVGTSFTNIKNEITNQINNEISNVKGDSLVKKDAQTNYITIGAEVEGSKINIANKNGGDRTLSGVKDAVQNNEAVNKGQLDKGIEDVNKDITNKFESFTQNITNITQQVQGDALLWSKSDGAFSAQHGEGDEKAESKITHLKAGDISADSTDAINGAQLFTTNKNVTAVQSDLNTVANNTSKYLGGNADVLSGTVPTFSVQNKEYHSVGEAFAGVDSSFTKLHEEINKNNNEVTQHIEKDALLWNDDAQAFVARHEKSKVEKDKASSENSKITFLSDGNIASGSTDAVTGGQLYSMNEQLATYFGGGAGYNKKGEWKAPTFKVKTVKEDGNSEDKNYTNVAEALSEVGTSFTNVQNKITNEITNQINHLQSDDSAVVHYDKQKNGTINYGSVTFGGKDQTPTALHNVANGIISDKSHDAVTGGQIYKIGGDIAKFLGGNATFNNGVFTGPTYKLSYIAKDGVVTESSLDGVGTAIAGLDINIKNVNQRIKEVSQGVAQDSLSWSKDDNAFSAQHGEEEKTNSKIKFLANGEISAASTEAVNGSQLYSLGKDVAKYFGGGAEYKDGKWTPPSFVLKTFSEDGNNVTEKTYNDVGSAFAGIDTNFTNVNNHLTHIVEDFNKKVDNINKEVKGDALLWSNEDNAFVAQHEKEGQKTNSKLKFLANGDVSVSSTEAVNGSQLFETNNKVATYFGGGAGYKDGAWSDPTFTVKTVKDDGKEENQTYKNVAEAFEGVGTSITNVQNKVTNDITNKFNDFTQNITNITQQVQGDALLWSNDANAFVADHGKDDEKANSRLTHLLDGIISKDSTDAITGKQLYSLGDDVAKSLGGTGYDEKGNWKAPTFKVKTVKEDGKEEEKTYQNVAEAFEGVGTSFTNVQNKITNEITNQINHLQSDDSAVVHYDKKGEGEIDYTHVTFGKGKDSAPVALRNVADGSISDKSREAITGGQIYKIGEDIAKFLGGNASFNNGAFTEPTYKLSNIDANGKITGNSFNDVGSAFAGLDTNIKNVNQRIKEVSQGVAQDSLSWSNDDSAFVALHGDSKDRKASKLKFLAAGDIAVDSNEAITGGQLYSINNTLATYFGGGAKYAEGQWIAPKFTVKTVNSDGEKKDETYQNVAEAFEGVGTSITNVQNNITNEITNQINHLQSDDSAVVHYDKNEKEEIDYTSVTFGGKGQTPTTLRNVADGSISDKSHEAITGGQIYKIGDDIAKSLGGKAAINNGAFTGPTYQLSEVSEAGQVTEKSFNDVGSAFAGLDTNIKNVNNRIKEVSEGVAQDSLNWSNAEGSFVAQHGEKDGKKTDSKIKFLAAGEISSASTEAVNGSQLYSLGEGVAQSFGGGAKYEEGKWKAPSFKVKTIKENGESEEKEYKNVAEALTGVGSSFTNIKNEITNQINHLQSDDSAVVHYDKNEKEEIDYTSVTLGKGKNYNPVGLHNIADGHITKDSHDAITGGQINTIGESIAKFLGGEASFKDGGLTQPIYKLSDVTTEGKVTDKSFTDVGSAFAGLDTNIKNVNNRIKEVSEGVAQDSLNWSSTEGAFVAQHGEKEKTNSKIKFLANGAVSKESTEAVNGSQLYSLGEGVAQSFGGGAEYKDGQWKAPSFTLKTLSENGKDVTEKTYNDVSSAFAGIDANFQSVNKHVQNIVNDFTEQVTNITQEVQGDALLWDKASKAFVAQHGEKGDKKENSKITSLANGDISKVSTDAVTGSQLYLMNEQFASYFGGGAGYNEQGKWNAPTFKVKKFDDKGKGTEQEYKTVAEAFEGVNQSFTDIHNEVNEQINQVVGDSLVKQDKDSHVILVGGETNGTKVSFANTDGTERVLSGVQAGDLSAKSTEAVNGSQLYSMSNTLATYFGGGAGYDEKGKWSTPTFKVKKFDDKGQETEQEYKTVAEAFEGVNQSFTNIHNEVNEQIHQVVGDSLVKQDPKTHVISVGSEKSGTQVSFANTDGIERVLSGVKAGDISVASTEAVNGSQLFETNNKVATYLGGGASYKDGTWSNPSFKVKTVKEDGESEEQEYKNVAEALSGVGTSFTNIKNEITKQVNNLQSDDSAVVHYDKKEKDEIDYTSVTFGKGKNSTAVGLHNVADGKITEGSHDAVTGGQINKIGADVAKFLGGAATFKDGSLTQPTYALSEVSKEGQITDKSFTDVSSAFTGLDRNIKNVNDRIKEVSQGVAKDSLNWSNADSAFVALHGESDARKESKITHILNGDVTKGSTDAVTGGQLYSMNEQLATYFGGGSGYDDKGKWTNPTFKVKTVKDDGGSGEESY